MLVIRFLCVSLLCVSSAYALEGEFVTIIGPDGHPMNVPYPEKSRTKKQDTARSGQQQTTVKAQVLSEGSPLPQAKISNKPVSIVSSAQQDQVMKKDQQANLHQVKPVVSTTVSPSNNNQTIKLEKNQQTPLLTPPQNNTTPEKNMTTLPKPQAASTVSDQPFEIVEGEKYFDAEFLESKEFNLEHKKRFYQIPNAAGGSAWDMVEREKGADMTWFRSHNMVKKKAEPVVLGAQYKILSKTELLRVLPESCIALSKPKPKPLTLDKPLSLWPRPALKPKFDYELVSLKGDIQDFALISYSKSIENTEYYWPMVVFLDEKGCVLEGVSAYFTQAYAATVLQNPAIEGFLHVPQQSKYVLLTALERAVDIPDFKLSNQGQIRLTVLR